MTLRIPDDAARAALADVVARVVRLDQEAVVRLRGAEGRVAGWASTPFDVLAAATAPGEVTPADVTVVGTDLLAALSIVDRPELDPGSPVDDRWRGPVPPPTAWHAVGTIPASAIDARIAEGVDGDLDETVWEGGGVPVPRRCVLAVGGLGWPPDGEPVPVEVSADGDWLRLVTGPDRQAAIVRHRRPRLLLRPV